MVIWAHVALLIAVGVVTGRARLGVAEALALAALAAGANWAQSRRARMALGSTALVGSSALLVVLGGGGLWHLHFFATIGMVTLYQAWLPCLVAIGAYAVFLAGAALVAPATLYAHGALQQPLIVVIAQVTFVGLTNLPYLISWRFNETLLTDQLTGLLARTLFEDRLEHALARARRTGATVALLYADVDDFKRINDTFGHQVGDRVLVEVARRLRVGLRESDSAARLGGDEFAMLLENSSAEHAQVVVRRLMARLERPVRAGVEVRVSMSVGVALSSAQRATPAVLLAAADRAMYAAKRGRTGWQVS